jgi:hypothetical protein
MARDSFFSVIGLALALAGCGGEDRGRPSAERTPELALNACDLADSYAARTEVITPFEDPERLDCAIARDCNFNFNLDAALSPGHSGDNAVCPTDDPVYVNLLEGATSSTMVSNPRSTPMPDARCGSLESAFHLVTRNMAVCTRTDTGRRGWGGSSTITLRCDQPGCEPFDASEFDGISMWVKKGDGRSGETINVSVVDDYTGGGTYCDQSDPNAPGTGLVPDTEKCDGFGVAVTLTDEWSFIPVRFDAMRQKGFGKVSPLGQLDVSRIHRIQILVSSGDWDFWIDHLGFFRDAD